MFEKTLTDLIRGLRANKKDEQKYIQSAILECKKEAKSQDLDVKAGAILKLTYLAMFGQDMSWASFYTVEVMASPRFVNKRIGYMAASQGFRQDTDVLMLATNLMKKDIASSNPAEVSVALGGLGDVVTPDLARDLGHDLISMLSHSKATVRKKAVLVMYKIFLQYPEALRSSYPKLRERLEDSDQSVVSATVNVIVELSRRNPKNYLPLAPALFEILTTSSNNWMLIKIIKLFATLTPLEPRLAKKLISPLTELIQSTTAMSLLYECINTVISGDMLDHPSSEALAQLCISKLRTFFEQDDQNLKYVALIAFTKVIGTHAEMVSRHQDVILRCIDDPDISIRMRALELVSLMPSKKSLPEIVKRLVKQLLPSSEISIPLSFRKDLVMRILHMCGTDMYKHVDNFDWYLAVLVDLVKVAKVDVAAELRDEIRNVCVRVKSVREFAVPILARLMCNREIIENAENPDANANALTAAVWVVGEYNTHLEDSLQTLQDLLAAPFERLAEATQRIYLQAIPKLYTSWVRELPDFESGTRSQVGLQTQRILRRLDDFTVSTDIEVQQRAVELVQLMSISEQCIEAASDDLQSPEVPKLFNDILPNLYFSGGDLNPIAPTAQSSIPVPVGLDLDSWINLPTPPPSPVIEQGETEDRELLAEEDELTLEDRRRARRERNKDDPFYIRSDSPPLQTGGTGEQNSNTVSEIDLDAVPVMLLGDDPIRVKRKKYRTHNTEPVEILNDELPEGMTLDLIRPASTPLVMEESTKNNVLRVDGSKLSAFDLDAQRDDDGDAMEAYQVVSEAKKLSKAAKAIARQELPRDEDSRKSSTRTASKHEKDKKREKKSKKRKEKHGSAATEESPVVEDEAKVVHTNETITIPSDMAVIEVVRKKKASKSKRPVDLA